VGPGWWQAADGNWYPAQPGYAPAAAPKRRFYKRAWFWLLVLVLAIITAIIAATVAANSTQHTIVYTVTGTGTPTISYGSFDNNHSGEAQVSDASLPWTKTITGSGIFNSYSVTATLGAGGGTLTCSIRVDGTQVSHNTATGAFATAACTGRTS
jgi:Mycobacterium membrane protein